MENFKKSKSQNSKIAKKITKIQKVILKLLKYFKRPENSDYNLLLRIKIHT